MQIPKLVLALAISGLAAGAQAADYSDPTWPCVQRKVENLSLGLMWPYPVDASVKPAPELRAEIAQLAEFLALRRIEVEEVEPRVVDFVAAHGGSPELLGQVFAEVFDTLAQRRTRIMAGIADFSLSQIALSEKIESARVEMDTLMAAAEPDYDKVDALEEQVDWEQTIYSDRQKSIVYLCETPVLLEKRLFAVAQMLQRHVKEGG